MNCIPRKYLRKKCLVPFGQKNHFHDRIVTKMIAFFKRVCYDNPKRKFLEG